MSSFVALAENGQPLSIFDITHDPKKIAANMGIDLQTTAIEQFIRQVFTRSAGVITEYIYHTQMPDDSFHKFINTRHPGDGFFSPKIELILREPEHGFRVYLWQDYHP